jgi:hypothetical protein
LAGYYDRIFTSTGACAAARDYYLHALLRAAKSVCGLAADT